MKHLSTTSYNDQQHPRKPIPAAPSARARFFGRVERSYEVQLRLATDALSSASEKDAGRLMLQLYRKRLADLLGEPEKARAQAYAFFVVVSGWGNDMLDQSRIKSLKNGFFHDVACNIIISANGDPGATPFRTIIEQLLRFGNREATMYTQDVVCPSCAQMTTVNVIETEGAIRTPCGKCGVQIQITTGSNGQVVACQYVPAASQQATGCAIIPIIISTGGVLMLLRHLVQ